MFPGTAGNGPVTGTSTAFHPWPWFSGFQGGELNQANLLPVPEPWFLGNRLSGARCFRKLLSLESRTSILISSCQARGA